MIESESIVPTADVQPASYFTPTQKLELEAAVFEAVPVYDLVVRLRNWGREVIVIGNRTYGASFVTEPIRTDLEACGAQVRTNRVSSSGTSSSSVLLDLFTAQTVKEMLEHSSDIVIVDGTERNYEKGYGMDRKIPRLPSAMYGYLNWFIAFNEAAATSVKQIPEEYVNLLRRNPEYKTLTQRLSRFYPRFTYQIRHYVPSPQEKVLIGSEQFDYSAVANDGPQVILMNPVISPDHYQNFPPILSGHKPGYFDDYDRILLGKKPEEFVAECQNYMQKLLPYMIRQGF